MKTVSRIEKNIDELRFGYYENNKFVELIGVDDPKITITNLTGAIAFLTEEIRRTVGLDLNDIWERLNKLENQIKEKQ